jgi:hypothetical protein
MTFTSNMVDGTRNANAASAMQVLVRASIACGGLSVLLTNFLALSPLFLRGNVMFSFSFSFILFFSFFSFVLFFGPDAHSNALMMIQGKRRRLAEAMPKQSVNSREFMSLPSMSWTDGCHQKEVVFA